MLNARFRKMWLAGKTRFGLIGAAADLTYRLRAPGRRRLGAAGARQVEVRVREGAEGRRAAGDRGGAGGAAPTAAVLAAVGRAGRGVQRRARGLERLERAAHRRGPRRRPRPRLRAPATAARRAAELVKKGALGRALPAGRRRDRPLGHRRLRRLPRHPRRSRRAPGRRHPAGRGLHREGRPLRQHRGPRAARRARGVPEGRGARGLGDPARALRAAGRQAALRHRWTSCARSCSPTIRPSASSTMRRARRRPSLDLVGPRRRGRALRRAVRQSPIKAFYLTNPIARASVTMAECAALAAGAQKLAAE